MLKKFFCVEVCHIVCLRLHVKLTMGGRRRHFALQKRPHNLVAPNPLAYIATSQKGMACTPRDPKCGRFFFIFLDFGHTPPQPFLASCGQPRGGGGKGGGSTNPAAASCLEHPLCYTSYIPFKAMRLHCLHTAMLGPSIRSQCPIAMLHSGCGGKTCTTHEQMAQALPPQKLNTIEYFKCSVWHMFLAHIFSIPWRLE